MPDFGSLSTKYEVNKVVRKVVKKYLIIDLDRVDGIVHDVDPAFPCSHLLQKTISLDLMTLGRLNVV